MLDGDWSSDVCSSDLSSPIQHIVENGGFMAGTDRSSVRFRASETFVPASTLKILTAYAAMETLGPEFRFTTSFYFDRQTRSLYIRGGGDPMLVSESVTDIAKIIAELLKKQQVDSVTHLYLDDSAFSVATPPPGSAMSDNPYDTQNSALAVNFNALPIRVNPDGTVVSAEPQTPTLPIIKEIGEQFSPGEYRVNIYAYPQLCAAGDPALRYTAELFAANLLAQGIHIGHWQRKVLPTDVPLLYRYQGAKNLNQILRPCLKYSNNFIANQLFLAVGLNMLGQPVTWTKGQLAMSQFIAKKMPTIKSAIQVVDGAGLSRDNRISPTAMIALLDRFRPYSFLLPEIKNRLIKSGTLKGVYCYAGYFQINGSLVPFALFLNQDKNRRDEVIGRLEGLAKHMLKPRVTTGK
jgi:D-alanyl-D-alanine carboxypeptidase/D-alanyl-D-alanine-endopeptidase (penicillin-binding protein 4)